MDNVKIEKVSWPQQQMALAQIRHRVFLQEQRVPEEDEWDGADDTAEHFLASISTDKGHKPIGCARLLPSGKIGRIAVLVPFRDEGVGTALLEHIVNDAQVQGFEELYLDAQTHAVAFYERMEFVAEGPEFMDAGIPHQRMRRKFSTSRQSDTGVLRLTGLSDSLAELNACILKARQSIEILSEQLSPALYADPELVASISALARRSSRSQIRVLVKDTRPLRGRIHGLLETAQRLPSRIDVRGLKEMPQDPSAGYCIIDKRMLIYFNQESELVGFSNKNARADARRLLAEFDHLWEQYGFTDPNLKKLFL
jgi:predicted GNAT family N-acyltransferase